MNGREVLDFIRRNSAPHYVYVLRKPDGAPFYVGVGTGRRVLDHAIFARRPELDSHKLRVIRKLWRSGEDINYSIHAFFDRRSDAESEEAALILRFGRRDLRTGSLANITAGGEGAPNPSDASLSARSVALKAAWAQRDKVVAMAHLNTPEVRAKTAVSRTGRKRGPYNWTKSPGPSAEARERASERMKADPISRRPGMGAKISAGKLGKKINSWMRTPAAKERFSRGAHPRARPVEVKGMAFACKQDAVEQLPVPLATLDYWLRRGTNGARYLSATPKDGAPK